LHSLVNRRFLLALLVLSSTLSTVTLFPLAEATTPKLSVDGSSLQPTGSTFTVNVEYQFMPAFNFYEVYVVVNSASLSPVKITLGPADATWTVLADCLNGVGTGCTIVDGAGVAHSAAVSSTGASISGHGGKSRVLFTISYTAINQVPSSSITIISSSSSILNAGNVVTLNVVNGVYK
jgi:hypothetical protein